MSGLERHWSASYLGLPYARGGAERAGVSCWGVVCLAYREQKNIVLPTYQGEPGAEELAEVAAALDGNTDGWPWREVYAGDVRSFDLVTFHLRGIEGHVGLVPWPGAFLHVGEGITSRIERYGWEQWRPMVSRFLRHRDLN